MGVVNANFADIMHLPYWGNMTHISCVARVIELRHARR